MNAIDIERLLSIRYSSPAYAFFTQVRNQTGFSNTKDGVRSADGLALSLYPSRGLNLHGFEIKVYKSDWKKELKSPEKADAIGRYCHYWWMVAPAGLIDSQELPDNWGLLEAYEDKIMIKKQAVFVKPEPITFPIVCGILRKASESMTPNDLVQAKIKERTAGIEKSLEIKYKYQIDDCKKLEERVAKFEEISGVKIDGWGLENVAAAVKIINSQQGENYISELKRMKSNLDDLSKRVGNILEGKDQFSE